MDDRRCMRSGDSVRARVPACLMLIAALAVPGVPQRSYAASDPLPTPQAALEWATRKAEALREDHRFIEEAQVYARYLERHPENVLSRESREDACRYMVQAYTSAFVNQAEERYLEQALAAIEAYGNARLERYGDRRLHPEIEAGHADFHRRLGEIYEQRRAAEAAKQPEPAPPPRPPPLPVVQPWLAPPAPKPWKQLAAGGGVALGGGVPMLAMFGVGVARLETLEREIEDPHAECFSPGDCPAREKRGEQLDRLASTGLIAGSLLVAAGIALLAVAVRRRSQQSGAPRPGVTARGLTLSLHF